MEGVFGRGRGPRLNPEQRLAVDAAEQLMRTEQGRRVLLVLALLALLVLAGWWMWQHQLRPHHPVGPTVRVATWNLREFSDRPNVDYREIADVITSSKFDVLAVQEVKKNGEAVDRLLNVLGVPWRATHFSEMTGNSERFVFLYNGDHVRELGSPHFIDDADALATFDRRPYQQSFRAGNFDFTLISVHLSYGDVHRRQLEAEALARFARRLASTSAEKDVIVLGDFNEESHSSAGSNLHYFTDAGLESLNQDPTNLKGTEVYDTLIIDPNYTREWNGTSASVHFDESPRFGNNDRQALESVSDHRPAYADFVTTLPDDD